MHTSSNIPPHSPRKPQSHAEGDAELFASAIGAAMREKISTVQSGTLDAVGVPDSSLTGKIESAAPPVSTGGDSTRVLVADLERYRARLAWVAEQKVDVSYYGPGHWWIQTYGGRCLGRGDSPEEAIDAAMATGYREGAKE